MTGLLHCVGSSLGLVLGVVFFFSSRRRHTRFDCDWSSDVCSSDLQTMRDTILVNRGTCYACAVACKREVEVKELGVTPKYGGPEYETLAASGSLCGVSDLNALALINQLYAQYVLDSISAGAVGAFAMECYEHGIITPGDDGGGRAHVGQRRRRGPARPPDRPARGARQAPRRGRQARRPRARSRRRAVRAARQGAGAAHARPAGQEGALARLRALADRRRPHGGAARPALRRLPPAGPPARGARPHRAARSARARRQEGARVLRDAEGVERLQLGRDV